MRVEAHIEDSTAKEHRTVSRIAMIMESIACAAEGLRPAELVEALDAPKSSVHGLVKALIPTGYLAEQRGVYKLGAQGAPC